MTDPLIPVPVDDPLRMAWFETNDFGNARRFAQLSRGLILWVDDSHWMAFDGQRWSEREGHFRARMLAHEVAQHIHEEAAALGDLVGDPKNPDERALKDKFGDWCTGERALDRLKDLHGWAKQTGEARRTSGMLTQAQAIPDLRAWSEDFDQDPLAYNVRNGTLRFRLDERGRWAVKFQSGHEPSDMISQLADVEYDPEATCAQWEERLRVVQPDPEQRAIFGRMYGQTLTGLIDCEEFYVHKGRGGDGKTKTHEIVAAIHGDYYRHSGVKTFLKASFQKSGSEHRSDLVRLAGDIRMVLCDEPPPQVTWDGELLKQATGGGTITARGSNERTEITFRPRWKLFIEVNPLPRMPGDDKGFRRRFRLVLWPVDLSRLDGGFEPPEQLRRRLLEEKSGILNWLIVGCLEWLGDRRVPVPQAEAEALVDFWAQTSPFGEWIEEECDTTDADAVTGTGVLHQAFKDWMARNSVEEEVQKRWNITKFGRELTQRQHIGVKDRRGNKVRKGIKLLGDAPLMDRGGGGSAVAETGGDDAMGWPTGDPFDGMPAGEEAGD